MKRILIFLLIAAVIGGIVGYSMWNKPHKDMGTAKADVTVEATQLFNEYNENEETANAKYLGKTIAVTGLVREVSSEEGTVKVNLETGSDFGVLCELDPLSKHPRTDFKPGETVTLKGDCAGLNLDIQLSRCVEAK